MQRNQEQKHIVTVIQDSYMKLYALNFDNKMHIGFSVVSLTINMSSDEADILMLRPERTIITLTAFIQYRSLVRTNQGLPSLKRTNRLALPR